MVMFRILLLVIYGASVLGWRSNHRRHHFFRRESGQDYEEADPQIKTSHEAGNVTTSENDSEEYYSEEESEDEEESGYDSGYEEEDEPEDYEEDSINDFGKKQGSSENNNVTTTTTKKTTTTTTERIEVDLAVSCKTDGDCLDRMRPQCKFKQCQKVSGGVLLMGGIVSGRRTASVVMIGTCDMNVVDLPEGIQFAAATLWDGKVYHCGGEGEHLVSSCYIRTDVGSWIKGPALNHAVYGHTLNTVGSKLVSVGGFGKRNSTDTIEVLEKGKDAWKILNSRILPARHGHCAVTVSDTELILVGGLSGSSYVPKTERLNVNNGSTTRYEEADLLTPVYGHACTLYNNKIMLSGGMASKHDVLASVYILDIEKGKGAQWAKIRSLEAPRYYHTMEMVGGVPTVYGGNNGESSYETWIAEEWRKEWLSPGRGGHSSVVIC